MPEQPKESRPLQENVNYWLAVDRNGLAASGFGVHPLSPSKRYAQEAIHLAEDPECHLIRVTLKAVSDG